jgi:hypothetical protein
MHSRALSQQFTVDAMTDAVGRVNTHLAVGRHLVATTQLGLHRLSDRLTADPGSARTDYRAAVRPERRCRLELREIDPVDPHRILWPNERRPLDQVGPLAPGRLAHGSAWGTTVRQLSQYCRASVYSSARSRGANSCCDL